LLPGNPLVAIRRAKVVGITTCTLTNLVRVDRNREALELLDSVSRAFTALLNFRNAGRSAMNACECRQRLSPDNREEWNSGSYSG
jgi:hypothetical protein